MLLPQIYQVSIKASKDNDKVKCNAVRALGSILYLCPNKHILKDASSGLEALINCATVGNDMKVHKLKNCYCINNSFIALLTVMLIKGSLECMSSSRISFK